MEKKTVPVPSMQDSPQKVKDFLKICVNTVHPDVTDTQMHGVWEDLMANNVKVLERLKARKVELVKKKSPLVAEYTKVIGQIQRLRVPIVSVKQAKKQKLSKAITHDIAEVLRTSVSRQSPLKTLSEGLLATLPIEILSHMDLSFVELIRLSQSSKDLYDRIMANPSIQIQEQVIYIPAMEPWLKKLKNIKLGDENLQFDQSLQDIARAGSVTTLAIRSDSWRSIDPNVLGAISGLQSLSLYKMGLDDISPFSNLRSLHSLDLNYVYVDDFSPLENLPLHSLNLADSDVKDISFLKTLSSLHTLNLDSAIMGNLAPLANLTLLHTLDLTNTKGVEDLSPLERMLSLHTFSLADTGAKDITPLANLRSIHTLDLSYTAVDDISALANMQMLHTLLLVESPVKDISALANITTLIHLNLSRTLVDDISTLSVSNLRELYLSYTAVESIAVLADAHKLHTLELLRTRVKKIGVLRNLPDLYNLILPETVTEISVLTNLHNLHKLVTGLKLTAPVKAILEKIPSLKIYNNYERVKNKQNIIIWKNRPNR